MSTPHAPEPEPQWQPITQLPAVARIIDELLAGVEEQYQTLQHARPTPHVLDDGIAVSHHLRADPGTADIPIILMSAAERLRATGTLLPVNDRMAKPFELPTLYSKVERWAEHVGVKS